MTDDKCQPRQVLLCTDRATIIKRKRFGICNIAARCRECDGKDSCKFVCPNTEEVADEAV